MKNSINVQFYVNVNDLDVLAEMRQDCEANGEVGKDKYSIEIYEKPPTGLPAKYLEVSVDIDTWHKIKDNLIL